MTGFAWTSADPCRDELYRWCCLLFQLCSSRSRKIQGLLVFCRLGVDGNRLRFAPRESGVGFVGRPPFHLIAPGGDRDWAWMWWRGMGPTLKNGWKSTFGSGGAILITTRQVGVFSGGAQWTGVFWHSMLLAAERSRKPRFCGAPASGWRYFGDPPQR